MGDSRRPSQCLPGTTRVRSRKHSVEQRRYCRCPSSVCQWSRRRCFEFSLQPCTNAGAGVMLHILQECIVTSQFFCNNCCDELLPKRNALILSCPWSGFESNSWQVKG